jgi:hypothetical protein
MISTFSLSDARDQLNTRTFNRLAAQWANEHGFSLEPMRFPFERARFPVGMFFIRGDREGEGKKLADQVVASFGFWHLDTGKYFDMIFPGWFKDSDTPAFSVSHFKTFNEELDRLIKWKEVHKGETDILLLNFDYLMEERAGDFSFDETIYLPVEEMLRDHRITSLDSLMYELARLGEALWSSKHEKGIWELSDRIGFLRGRKAFWDIIKEKFKVASRIYNELRPYAVCDLRR